LPDGKVDDGWVGFGGKAGNNWFLYRLASAGHLHWPTKDYTQLAAASYDRGDLSMTDDPMVLAGGDDVIYATAKVEWQNIFPGVDLQWVADGIKLKEEIVVSAAARAVWESPLTPKNETFATFIFEMDTIGIPFWAVDGLPQSLDEGFDDRGGEIEMWEAVEDFIAFMPIDFCFPDTRLPDDPQIRIRKRMFRDGGKDYLAVGITVEELESLPAGNIIFDPSFSTQPGSAGGKDSMSWGDNTSRKSGSGDPLYLHPSLPRHIYIEFDCSSLSGAFTCDDATIYLTSAKSSYAWDTNETITAYSLHSNVEDWEEANVTHDDYKSGSAWPGSGGAGTADTDYESGSLGSGLGPGGTGQGSFSLTASRVEGWFGIDNTNYGLKLVQDINWSSINSSDASSGTDRPKLVINYTEGPSDPAAAGAVAGGLHAGAVAGAETIVGSVLVASVPPKTLNTRGNLFWNTKGPQLSVMMFVTHDDDWVQMDAGGTPAAITHGFQVIRTKAYLTPQ